MVAPSDLPVPATGSIRLYNAGPADGDTVTIGDGLTSVTFEFDEGTAATGSITLSDQPADEDTITICDGTKTVVFEFDDDASTTEGNVSVTIGASADETMANLITAINGETADMAITATASDPADNACTLANDYPGTSGNSTITTTGEDIVVTGMTGGAGPGNGAVTGTNTAIAIGTTKAISASNLADAINASNLRIRASAKHEAILLTNEIPGASGNVAITETGSAIEATGMTSGKDIYSDIVGDTKYTIEGGTTARSSLDRARYYVEDQGAVGDGVTDDTAAIRRAILWCSYAARDGINRFDTLHFKSAHYKITGTLTLNQGISLQGNGMLDGGTRIIFDGGETESAIVVTPGQSGVGVYDLMVEDVRTVKTSGYGVKLDRCVNYCACERVQANFFPSAGIFVGSSVGGSSGDCMRVRDCWVTSSVDGSNGIEVTNVDNTVIIEGILSDQSGGGAVVRIHGVANDQASIRISDIKHEAQDDDTATIDIVYPNYGNLSIFNIIQRTPIAATASPVIRTSGTPGGKGVRLYGISGDDHSEWGVDAPTLYDGVTGNEVHLWEPITGMIAPSGRAVRTLSGDGSPAESIYGNPGDTYTRTDGTSQNPTFWTKSYGDGTTTGWLPVWPSFDEDAVWSPSVANGAVETFAFPVTKGPAFVGFHVSVSLSPGVPNGVLVSAGINTNGLVSIVIRNDSGSEWSPGNTTFRMRVTANS